MRPDTFSIWAYLSTTPLLWLTVTLVAWLIADQFSKACKDHPLANPVLIAILIVLAVITISGAAYERYFEGARFVHFMLGPATVALAIPLLNNGRTVIKNLWPILAALFVGSVTAILTAIGLATALGLPREAILALAPKSTTAAVAMGISETVGGPPELTAVMVILTGIIGAILVTPLMNTLRISDYAARGFAVGLTAHGIGTARAFTVNPLAGTFAGIALVLNAILTALLVPTLLVWMDAVLG